MKDFSNLRKKAFAENYLLPAPLIEIAETEKSHFFLTNPTALSCYVYLVNYYKKITEEVFPKKNNLRILDWGCGKGQISYLLREIFPTSEIVSCDVGGDLAKDDSTFGQKTPLIEHFQIEIVPLTHPTKLPFADASFDLVLSIGVLEHVASDQASLHEIHRILDHKGLFACAFLPYTLSWTQKLARLSGDTYHDRLYDWKTVDRLLESDDFRILDSWHRALFPKNPVKLPYYRKVEALDQWLCQNTPLKHLATNIEFIAQKQELTTKDSSRPTG